MRILEIKFERNRNLRELNLEIEILKNYLKAEF